MCLIYSLVKLGFLVLCLMLLLALICFFSRFRQSFFKFMQIVLVGLNGETMQSMEILVCAASAIHIYRY